MPLPRNNGIETVASPKRPREDAWLSVNNLTKSTAIAAVSSVRLREPYERLGSQIADDLGVFNVAHIRRTDLVLYLVGFSAKEAGRNEESKKFL